jgi:hypothetical protein
VEPTRLADAIVQVGKRKYAHVIRAD